MPHTIDHTTGLPIVPPTGLIGAEAALRGGFTGGVAGLQSGAQNAIDLLSGGFLNQTNQIGQTINQGIGGLQGFADPGRQATNLLSQFSGAAGQPAQAQAFQNFQQNPLTQFLQQQGERGLLRTAGARGQLGGGNIEKDLLRFNQGLSLQGLQTQFGLLGDLSQRGLGAAGQQAGLRGQEAGFRAGLTGQILPLGGLIREREGRGLADLSQQTGRDLAFGRTRAGENIAGAIGDTSSALARLRQGLGQDLSETLSGSNLANLLTSAGFNQAQSQQDLAAILANINLGQGSQVTGLPGIPGTQQTPGALGGLGQLAGGVGGLLTGLAASDERLKNNIVKIGETEIGTNLYKWDWTEEGKLIAGNQISMGVIAQELLETQPDAVILVNGFYRVDYARIH